MKVDLTGGFTNKDIDNIMKLVDGETENEAELLESYNKFMEHFKPTNTIRQFEYIKVD